MAAEPSKIAPAGVAAEPDEEKPARASMRTLWKFASWGDVALTSLAISIHVAIGAGMITPLFIFESFFDTAGTSQALDSQIDMATVEFVSLTMVYIALGIGLALFVANYPAGIAAANQKAAWKKAVVRAVLSQDVGWYDVSRPQDLSSIFRRKRCWRSLRLYFCRFRTWSCIALGESE